MSPWKNSQSTDRFANVSTLGLKHSLPLEDLRELVLGLLSNLQEEVQEAGAGSASGSIASNFRIAVAGWDPVLIHCMLFFLCRAKPCMPLRLPLQTQ